jgi:ferric-dicitrate binding protein FerR (iron transport regulator)
MLPDDVIETDSASRIAFRTSDGSSLRLDRASRTRVRSHTLFELADGTLYIATSETSKGLEVRTALGTLRDIGTRFEVRVHDGSLRLRVRSGLVEIHRNGGVIPALAGTETRVTSSGVDRTAVAIYGSEWDWTAALAPSFDIEGRPLAAFLEYVAREQGWTLRYSDAALATVASSIILHGSVRGLRAEPALSVALATSGLEYRLRAGELLVFRPRGPQ